VKKVQGKLVEFGELEELMVVGDLHGDWRSFSEILEDWDLENERSYILFLGDYADRGTQGFEIIERLIELGEKENIILLKGNHEDYDEQGKPLFYPCTLISEVESKYGDWSSYFSTRLKPFFQNLPLAALAEKSILFLHGGISSKIKSLDDLRDPSREIEMDLIWSDPKLYGSGESPNPRGAGVEFGVDVTEEVLKGLGIKLLIRSHQPRLALGGPHLSHENRVVTLASTSIYRGAPHYLKIPGDQLTRLSRNPSEIKKYIKFL
jgi:diadenosine tetraphosphatase ApaH/serine/threonine PP2A family protein phosphatase